MPVLLNAETGRLHNSDSNDNRRVREESFSEMTKTRLAALRELLPSSSVDGLLITRPENRRYITGFTGSAGVALVSQNHAFFVTDFRYVEQATYQAPEFQIVQHGLKIEDTLCQLAQEAGIGRLGFEKDVVTFKQHETLSSALSGVRLVPCEGLVEALREVKDENETELIRQAEAIGDAAFSHILSIMKPGMTEIDVALELEWFMRKNGAEGIGFDVIVASGPRGAMPHGVASDKKLAQGDLVVLDFGAVYNGYRGDMTRTVSLGKATSLQRRVYDIVLRAQEAALEAIAPGKTGQEIDGIARGIIEEAGYGDNFGHGLGHGVGLAVHEEPRLSVTGTKELRPGMVVTVEPGIYLPGLFGIRIEDLVVVQEGGVRNLTRSPKELIEL